MTSFRNHYWSLRRIVIFRFRWIRSPPPLTAYKSVSHSAKLLACSLVVLVAPSKIIQTTLRYNVCVLDVSHLTFLGSFCCCCWVQLYCDRFYLRDLDSQFGLFFYPSMLASQQAFHPSVCPSIYLFIVPFHVRVFRYTLSIISVRSAAGLEPPTYAISQYSCVNEVCLSWTCVWWRIHRNGPKKKHVLRYKFETLFGLVPSL